jgi:hypothetical protein
MRRYFTAVTSWRLAGLPRNPTSGAAGAHRTRLPRNTDIIGGSLNAPTPKFRAECKALATK